MKSPVNKLRLTILLISLLFGGFLAWSLIWNSNGYYTGAYQEMVRPEPKAEQPKSQQPHSPGFAEKGIHKNYGKGYAVY